MAQSFLPYGSLLCSFFTPAVPVGTSPSTLGRLSPPSSLCVCWRSIRINRREQLPTHHQSTPKAHRRDATTAVNHPHESQKQNLHQKAVTHQTKGARDKRRCHLHTPPDPGGWCPSSHCGYTRSGGFSSRALRTLNINVDGGGQRPRPLVAFPSSIFAPLCSWASS